MFTVSRKINDLKTITPIYNTNDSNIKWCYKCNCSKEQNKLWKNDDMLVNTNKDLNLDPDEDICKHIDICIEAVLITRQIRKNRQLYHTESRFARIYTNNFVKEMGSGSGSDWLEKAEKITESFEKMEFANYKETGQLGISSIDITLNSDL